MSIRPLFLLFCLLQFACRSHRHAAKYPFAYSSKTDYYNAAQYEQREDHRLISLYTKHPPDVLMGNECVTSFTHELGFEYIYPFTTPGTPRNDLHIFFANLTNRTRLLFKNGFGWHGKVKSRIAQCRVSSGDDLPR